MHDLSYFCVGTELRGNPNSSNAALTIHYNYYRGLRMVGQVEVTFGRKGITLAERMNLRKYNTSFAQLTAQQLLYNHDIMSRTSVNGQVTETLLEAANRNFDIILPKKQITQKKLG